MVKQLFVAAAAAILLSSCAFFGSSAFPAATSDDISWFSKNVNKDYFYMMDNGSGEPLLFLAGDSGGTMMVLVFDTSLNLRGYMENGTNGVLTDGVGFVNLDGNYVIGQTGIGGNGSTDYSAITNVSVPNMDSNAGVIPWTSGGTDYYILIDNSSGYVYVYYTTGTQYGTGQYLGFTDIKVIPQADNGLDDVKIENNSTGEIYSCAKVDLYNWGSNNLTISSLSPEAYIDTSNYTQWITRTSRGYFVSTNNGSLVLLGFDGSEKDRIDIKNYSGQVVSVDYDCKYYYLLDEDRGRINKERVPF